MIKYKKYVELLYEWIIKKRYVLVHIIIIYELIIIKIIHRNDVNRAIFVFSLFEFKIISVQFIYLFRIFSNFMDGISIFFKNNLNVLLEIIWKEKFWKTFWNKDYQYRILIII